MKIIKPIFSLACLGGWILLSSCAGSGSKPGSDHTAAEGLSSRLNRSYGYQVDQQGNWVPKTDKRSQYEGRGGSAYFNGEVGKKSFQTNQLNKGSWMGGKEFERPVHRLNQAGSPMGGTNRFSQQQANLNRNLQTPERIEGNHLQTATANETSAGEIDRPSDAETDARRRVFIQPDIIDYRQQRELSIQQSKDLLGR